MFNYGIGSVENGAFDGVKGIALTACPVGEWRASAGDGLPLSAPKNQKSPLSNPAQKTKRLYCITVNSLISFMLFPRGNCVCLSARQYVRNFYLLFSRSHGTIRNRNRRRFNRHFYPAPVAVPPTAGTLFCCSCQHCFAE